MVIDPQAAAHFIAGYKSLLAEIHLLSVGEQREPELELLATARETLCMDPTLLETAAASLAARNEEVASDVLKAVRTLRLKDWIFLRDTTSYSVFIDPDGTEAYAVLGLNNRIRDIIGDSAVVLRTGVIGYNGRYVCDGIISRRVWLGPNLKRDFNTTLSRLRKSGRFHVDGKLRTPLAVDHHP